MCCRWRDSWYGLTLLKPDLPWFESERSWDRFVTMTKARQYAERIVSVETGVWRHECRIERSDAPQRYSIEGCWNWQAEFFEMISTERSGQRWDWWYNTEYWVGDNENDRTRNLLIDWRWWWWWSRATTEDAEDDDVLLLKTLRV